MVLIPSKQQRQHNLLLLFISVQTKSTLLQDVTSILQKVAMLFLFISTFKGT